MTVFRAVTLRGSKRINTASVATPVILIQICESFYKRWRAAQNAFVGRMRP